MHSIKSFTAKEINRIEGTSGEVWEQERFDRYVRGDRDLEEKFFYIVGNAERAGLVDREEGYPWIWTPEEEVRSGRMPEPAGGTPTLPGIKSDRYYLKAMNCPHHHSSSRRNRAVIATCRCASPNTAPAIATSNRGELFGLMRVRSLQMNDAHIYCTEEQFETSSTP